MQALQEANLRETLPGEPPHEWEPSRTITGKVPHHDAWLIASGNAIVPHQISPFLQGIVEYEGGRI
jgi:hypothetical protein